eukprot:1139993-Pelagomonas_calceolata.AAC.8
MRGGNKEGKALKKRLPSEPKGGKKKRKELFHSKEEKLTVEITAQGRAGVSLLGCTSDESSSCLNKESTMWITGRIQVSETKGLRSKRMSASLFREGKGYIAVPACGGSLAEAKRACNQTSPSLFREA